jgi:nucleotide-binding universal stress UspA family protein
MSGIICAVRGGPDSQPTIEKGIELARETKKPLYFLYVVNLEFLSHTQSSRVSTISDELDQMGEFILLMAQDKAKKRDVDAKGIVKHGNVSEEIVGLAEEISAEYVVLGLPTGKEDTNVFAIDRIKEFGKQIEEQCGAMVMLAGEETND